MTTTTTEQSPEIAMGAMALSTLSGDWRDRTMGLLKEYLPEYDKLPQAQQQDIIDRATNIGEQAATESLSLVAAKALPSMGMQVKGVARKGKKLAVQLEGPFTQANWNAWGSCEEMVAVQAAPDVYYGQRKALFPKLDQPALDLDEVGEAGEAEMPMVDDEVAAEMQAGALAEGESDGDEDALGPEAIANGEAIEGGIRQLDTGAAETLENRAEEGWGGLTAGEMGDGGTAGGMDDGGTVVDAAGPTGEAEPADTAAKPRHGRRTDAERAQANAATAAATPARRGRKPAQSTAS